MLFRGEQVPPASPAGTTADKITDNSGGTASTAVADVGATYTQATLNNIHASILKQLNAVISALQAAGIVVK